MTREYSLRWDRSSARSLSWVAGRLLKALGVVWDFSRPHTIVATSLSVACLYAVASSVDLPARSVNLAGVVTELLPVWIAACLVNLYIVGLNQVADRRIDAINKPRLPIPAGRLALRTAKWVVALAGAAAVGLGVALGTSLAVTLATAAVIGSLYSLPPVRLKRGPLGAALAIATVRGPVLNYGVAAHFLGIDFPPNLSHGADLHAVTLLAAVGAMFGVAVAVAKDAPDVEGDRAFAIRTFASISGRPRAIALAVGVAGLCLMGVAAGFAIHAGLGLATVALLVLNLAAWCALAWPASNLVTSEYQAGDALALTAFYRRLWLVFCLENVAVTIALVLTA